MPASHKMLKSRQQAANRAAGIGDEQGRLPSKVKAPEIMARCTVCTQEIRMTKKNIEAKTHFESRHPTSTFATCFPGQFDPTHVAGTAAEAQTSATPIGPTAEATAGATAGASAAVESASSASADSSVPVNTAPKVPKKKPAQDLSFLDAALDTKIGKRK